MTNLILENTNQVPYFTNMRSVLEGLRLDPAEYDWYLSDLETNYFPPGFDDSDQWFSGVDFRELLYSNSIQFIWGVFSAVPKGTRFTIEKAPYVNRNPDFWNGTHLVPQLPGSLFEIFSWDSSATILVGIPQESARHFLATFSEARQLTMPTS